MIVKQEVIKVMSREERGRRQREKKGGRDGLLQDSVEHLEIKYLL